MANDDYDNAATDREMLAKLKKEIEKNPAAVALGRLGGKKGGPARARKLSAEERSEIARRASRARWDREKEDEESEEIEQVEEEVGDQ